MTEDKDTYKIYLGVAETLVKKHMAQYDASHDWAHVDRVRRTALHIAHTLPGKVDFKVVELAALFHDVAGQHIIKAFEVSVDPQLIFIDSKYTSDPTSALTSTLSPFLSHPSTTGSLSTDQISLILRIIPAVSWTSESKVRSSGGISEWHMTCPELHAVQDADRLDAIGAIGIMRCSGFSTAKGRVLLDDDEHQGGSAEAHFDEKLFKIRDRMKTPFGKDEAERRHRTMEIWMEALQREKQIGR